MADETLKVDANNKPVMGLVTDDASLNIRMARIDDTTKGMKVMIVGGTGAGTVTSISGTGSVVTSPNPITTTGTVGLVNDSTTPGNSFYYGTNSSGTKGFFTLPAGGTGTVTTVSVATANGFAGTVATATTTPAITLTTSITGILQGNGTAISAATTTGSGSVVLATSPTLVTPALGTPSALVGTNITGTAAGLTAGTVTTNANLTGAVTSSGNATSLGSFTSAQLATALTDETGTGANVFANKPTFLGTIQTITAVAALALDGSLGNVFTKTIATGSTFTQSNFSTGQNFMLTISGAFTVTFFSGITWIATGGTQPTQTALTTYGFTCTGSNTFNGYLVGAQ